MTAVPLVADEPVVVPVLLAQAASPRLAVQAVATAASRRFLGVISFSSGGWTELG